MDILEGDEKNVFEFFSQLQQTYGGNWDGEELLIDSDDFGFINSVCYNFLEDINIGVTSLKLKRAFVYNNRNGQDADFIGIRIGFTGKFEGDNATKHNSRECIYIYNGNQEFSITSEENSALKWVFIRFPKDKFHLLADNSNTVITQLMENKMPWFYYSSLLPEINVLVNDIFNVMHQKDIRRGIFLGKAIEILTMFKRVLETNNQKHIAFNIHPSDIKQMVMLKDQLLEDYTIQPNLKILSENVGMSLSKLHRTFKKVYGMPILQFFNKHRIEEVDRLIRNTDRTLVDISDVLGYTHLSHMSRTYKKHFGYSPSDVKKA
ncbi:helix-turn-helix transcriptional regulator [Flammeovirga kamogawensis]|uniref:Helix-turn-helix transcriptional regulator n=1 Tax=Flammeovirga kamogawensis TaxID=373891 RepID=A0ABX8H256_9BACT|nr:AraC family transcriptional regulator [Flammeovirga kamogawensis]MBB6460176.1 AraC-like DNA-binding protein [Flammeovirga kamogawensis]QWG09988.1 helix-turn-helix transcriptional regulator [Flammeovirga kamogawensis]TRX65496.1 helix-turn-helix transcriptional regulator [Flammeovirga kamogawensis]